MTEQIVKSLKIHIHKNISTSSHNNFCWRIRFKRVWRKLWALQKLIWVGWLDQMFHNHCLTTTQTVSNLIYKSKEVKDWVFNPEKVGTDGTKATPRLDVSLSVRVGKTDFHLKNYNVDSTKTNSITNFCFCANNLHQQLVCDLTMKAKTPGGRGDLVRNTGVLFKLIFTFIQTENPALTATWVCPFPNLVGLS